MVSQQIYEIKDETWPVVTVHIISQVTPEFMEYLFDRWSEWLHKGEPFGMLYFFEASENRQSKEMKKMRKEWLNMHRPLISRHVAGMGMVVKAPAILNIIKPVAGGVAKKMFGCPVKVFTWDEQTRAREWIQSQIAGFKD